MLYLYTTLRLESFDLKSIFEAHAPLLHFFFYLYLSTVAHPGTAPPQDTRELHHGFCFVCDISFWLPPRLPCL